MVGAVRNFKKQVKGLRVGHRGIELRDHGFVL